MLMADRIIFVTEAKLGFISYKCKDLIDRIIPLALPYTMISEGAMRHKPRYKKTWKIGLVYTGDGEEAFLDRWLKRVTLNFFSESLGSYDIMKDEDLCYEIGNL
jgi:multimeric flavodoxin WrbA